MTCLDCPRQSVSSLLCYVLQVYIVTGGWADSGRLSSTEVLTPGTSAWQQTGHLPSPRDALTGVSIDSNFLVTGEQGPGVVILTLCNSEYSGGLDGSNRLSEVLRYDASTGDWAKIGDLQTPRNHHGVSDVDWDDVSAFCD